MTTSTSKALSRRIIFLLTVVILYFMLPQTSTMPLKEEAGFPFSMLSQTGIARVFAIRQLIAMDLMLFAVVMVIMQLIWEKNSIKTKNRIMKIVCFVAFAVVFLPIAYMTFTIAILLGKPIILSAESWVYLFGKQGGANQYILQLWWGISAVLLELGLKL